MDVKIVAGIFIGLLLVATIATIGVIKANSEDTDSEDSTISECVQSGNTCTAGNNCGLETCGAVRGGSCGCGR